MVLTKYNENIIKIFIDNLLKYLDNIENVTFLNSRNNNFVLIKGYNLILRIISIIHYTEMSEEQIKSYLEKAYMLYIEYSEQMVIKREEIIHPPTMFVYNVLIGNIALNSYLKKVKTDEHFIIYFTKWSNVLLFWNQKYLTTNNRKYIIKNFFSQYFLTFLEDSLFHVYRVFESIQNNLINNENIFDLYSMLLSSFHNYFIKIETYNNKQSIETLCFNKFVQNKEYFDTSLSEVKNKTDMDKLITWIFKPL